MKKRKLDSKDLVVIGLVVFGVAGVALGFWLNARAEHKRKTQIYGPLIAAIEQVNSDASAGAVTLSFFDKSFLISDELNDVSYHFGEDHPVVLCVEQALDQFRCAKAYKACMDSARRALKHKVSVKNNAPCLWLLEHDTDCGSPREYMRKKVLKIRKMTPIDAVQYLEIEEAKHLVRFSRLIDHALDLMTQDSSGVWTTSLTYPRPSLRSGRYRVTISCMPVRDKDDLEIPEALVKQGNRASLDAMFFDGRLIGVKAGTVVELLESKRPGKCCIQVPGNPGSWWVDAHYLSESPL